MGHVMKERIKTVFPWIWLIGGYIWDLWYHITRGKLMLDSDISAEMILADLLNKEHSVIGLSKNWIYSTGLRFLEMQWLFRIGLIIFPGNWHRARVFAMAIAIALMAFAVFLIFYAIGRSRWGVWGAAMVIFPGGGWYFWQTIYGGQYTPYILISLFSTAFIMLAIRDFKALNNRVYIILLLLLGFASGINGIKQLMVYHVPLCITAMLLLIIELRGVGERRESIKKVFDTGRFSFAILAWGTSFAALAGYLINKCILSNIYMFEEYDSTVIEYRSFFEYLKMFIWDYGFADGKILMSPWGVASMMGVVFGMLVVFSGMVLTFKFRDLSEGDQMLTLLSVVSILFCCFIFSYVSGHGDIQYFQPIIPFGYCLVVVLTYTLFFTKELWREVVISLIMFILLSTSMGTIHNEHDGPIHEYRAHEGLGPIVQMLMEKGYTQGVALFWTSDVVTELSNGKIEMWTLSTDGPDVMLNRLQKKDHVTTGPNGRYFYIFDYTDKEDEFLDDKIELGLAYVGSHPNPTEPMAIYFDENYVIYGN